MPSRTNIQTSTTKAIRILELFRWIDPKMQIGAASGLLEIALAEGLSVADLRDKLKVAYSSASRHAKYLGKRDRHGRTGQYLVDTRVSDEDLRRKELRLSRRGQLVMTQLVNIVESGKKASQHKAT